MQKLSDIVTSEGTTTNAKNSAILKTKFQLGEICHQKALQYLERKDKNIGKVYSKTYEIHSEIINDFERLYTNLASKYEKKKQSNLELQKEVEQLKESLERANLEKAAVLDIGENIEKQMQAKLAENEKIHEDYKRQIRELNEKLDDVEKENNDLFEKLVKHAKDRTERVLGTATPRKSEVHSKLESEVLSEKPDLPRADTFTLLNVGSAKRGEVVGPTSIRMVTLKQLKDIINEIYENKEKHDEKCRRTKLPLETMEQFMFTFLNQKYGLKNLIIEWAASIVNGVKCYMHEDSDVALFAKLLKNEIEEDFRYIQDKIKTTVSKVLKKYLHNKHKLKGEADITSMLEAMEQGYISSNA